MAIQILIDTAQPRVTTQSVSTLVTGEDWDLAASSADIYVDPATHTLMCRPGAFYDSWLTSNAGIQAKLPLSAFTTTPASGFLQHVANFDNAPYYHLPDNSSDAYGVMTSALSANQATVGEWFQSSTTPNPDDAVWFGWGANPTSPAAGDIAVKFYFNGDAEVYKSGALVGSYTMSGEKKARFNRNKPAKAQGKLGDYKTVVMIPCRSRELVVLSSDGTGFTHVFDDILEGTGSAVITPAAPFFFFVSAPTTCTVRCALCQFSAGGTAYGTASMWRMDPGAAILYAVDYDANGGTVTPSIVGSGVGPINVTVDLAGSGGASPFVYSARAYTRPVFGSTPGPGVDITEYVMSLSLGASDGNGGTHGHISIKDPVALEGLGVHRLSIQNGRPIRILDDGVLIFDGVFITPKTHEGVMFSPSTPGATTYGTAEGTNPIERVEGELRDYWWFAERYRQKEPVPLDGMTLQNAYVFTWEEFLSDGSLGAASIPGGLHVSDFDGFTLDHSGNVTTSEFNVINKPTETGAEELNKLHQTFAANAFHGYDPINGWRFLAQDDMPSAPVWTLYDGNEAWTTAGNSLDDLTPQVKFRTLDLDVIAAEANDVYVVGWDYRYRRPIISHAADTAAQDPTLTPSARPNNWSGDVLSYSFETPHVTTQDTANAACELLFDRLTNIRALIEIETDLVPVMQRGQVVKLVFQSLPKAFADLELSGVSGTSVLARIKTWDGHYQQGADGFRWAPAKYVLQVLDDVADAGNTHTGATSLTGIKHEIASMSAHRRPQEHDWFQEILKRPILLQAEV